MITCTNELTIALKNAVEAEGKDLVHILSCWFKEQFVGLICMYSGNCQLEWISSVQRYRPLGIWNLEVNFLSANPPSSSHINWQQITSRSKIHFVLGDGPPLLSQPLFPPLPKKKRCWSLSNCLTLPQNIFIVEPPTLSQEKTGESIQSYPNLPFFCLHELDAHSKFYLRFFRYTYTVGSNLNNPPVPNQSASFLSTIKNLT